MVQNYKIYTYIQIFISLSFYENRLITYISIIFSYKNKFQELGNEQMKGNHV